jgi:hypothetical protein
MTIRWTRVAGLILLGASLGWAARTVSHLTIVSPVHWPLLLPAIVVTGIPALAAAVTGAAYFARHRRAPQFLVVLLVSIGQSWLFSTAAPDIEHHYRETVEQSRELWSGALTTDGDRASGRGEGSDAGSVIGS